MLAPTRLTNAAAQLPLRGQVRRKETHPPTHPHRSRPYAARRGAMQASPPPVHTAPAPTRLFYYGSQIRIRRDAHRNPTIPPMLELGEGEERYKMHALRDWLPIEGA